MAKRVPVYIIAEIGINHNGSLKNCLLMIDAAQEAGCDCVKFQFFKAERLYPRSAGRLAWKSGKGKHSYNIFNAVRSFEMPLSWTGRLLEYAKNKKIDLLFSVFDAKGADYLMRRGVRQLKLSSYSVTDIPLLKHCASLRVPLILSTGATTFYEVEDAVSTVTQYHDRISLLHCSLRYPTPLKDCNLGVIDTLKDAFPGYRIGYSDHTKEPERSAVYAVRLGASIIEKHITLDRRMEGPDHFFALAPDELAHMVRAIRTEEKKTVRGRVPKELYGSSKRRVFAHERYLRKFCFGAIFAKKKISKGERIRMRDLIILRPGTKKRGLDPQYLALFERYPMVSKRKIKAEEPIEWEAITHA